MKYDIASAAVLGRDHREHGLSCQDACYTMQWYERRMGLPEGWHTIAIVSDGCGSAHQSEVGSRLGVEALGNAIRYYYKQSGAPASSIGDAAEDLRTLMRTNLMYLEPRTFPETHDQVIGRMFLFTILGVFSTPERTHFFSCGDGSYLHDWRQIARIDPGPENAPNYVGYSIRHRKISERADWLGVGEIDFVEAIDERPERIMVGTDGVDFLLLDDDYKRDLGSTQEDSVRYLFENDTIFHSQDGLRRILQAANRDKIKIDWENQKVDRNYGILEDDLAMVLLRKAKDASSD